MPLLSGPPHAARHRRSSRRPTPRRGASVASLAWLRRQLPFLKRAAAPAAGVSWAAYVWRFFLSSPSFVPVTPLAAAAAAVGWPPGLSTVRHGWSESRRLPRQRPGRKLVQRLLKINGHASGRQSSHLRQRQRPCRQMMGMRTHARELKSHRSGEKADA